MARFQINEAFLTKHKASIGQGEPVVVEVRDVVNMGFLVVKALLSPSEVEGGEPLEVLDMTSFLGTGQQWYIKILEEAPEEDEAPSWDESALKWSGI
ncbi:MAG TPA: hypothetical protein VJ256_05480 [Dehalococcoidia bacterium]|nr:hypothetical protein [Dehalococcoidia bacterium]HLB29463.1 hypothetical protein [Dehalococcoidia bacterium]